MTSENTIIDLLRFNSFELTPESLTQFHWGIYDGKNGLFSKFYEQIEAYTISNDHSDSLIYFGHFEFFKGNKGTLEIIDGTQRIISILAIVENVLLKLKQETKLEDELAIIDKKIGKYSSVKELNEVNKYIKNEFKHKNPAFLFRLFQNISRAKFSQRISNDKYQKFQLQSNKVRFNSIPSNLQKFKAYCYNHALKSDEDHRDWILNRFDIDFKYIYSRFQEVKFAVSEDDLFEIAVRCQDNCLLSGVVERNLEWFEDTGAFKFKYDFVDELLKSINALNEFFNHGPNHSFEIHEYISFNYYKTTLPIIVKAYMNKVSVEEITLLTKALLKIEFRHEIIGVYNSLGHRLFHHFLPSTDYLKSIKGVIETVRTIFDGKESPFLSHWSSANFKKALDQNVFERHRKFMLWVYENSLRKDKDQAPLYYQDLAQFNVVKINEEEKENLGNLLLVHHEQIGLSKKEFFKSLSLLNQQKEVVGLMGGENEWDKEMHKQRHERIKAVIYNKFR